MDTSYSTTISAEGAACGACGAVDGLLGFLAVSHVWMAEVLEHAGTAGVWMQLRPDGEEWWGQHHRAWMPWQDISVSQGNAVRIMELLPKGQLFPVKIIAEGFSNFD